MPKGREMEFREAIVTALGEELERDDAVIFYGEDVAKPGGVFAVTPGLRDRFGAERVFDTPISELAMSGAAFGAAVCGLRPVFEIMFGDFVPLAMDALVNQAAKYWYLSNGQASVPLVMRTAVGAGGRFGAVHSQSPGPWLLSVSGLKIACPATPDDARALLSASIRDDNPVLFLEHKRLYSTKGEVGEEPVELGEAKVCRAGTDVTIVSAMLGVGIALEAAEQLAGEGISAEVVDLRSLRPLDTETIARSLAKTNRLLVVEEGPALGGWSASVVAELAEHSLAEFDDLWRITTPDTPVPFAPTLEDAFLPNATAVADSVRERLGAAVA